MSVHPEGSPAELPGLTTDGFVLDGPVTTPERAWALIGDTDWLNRTGDNGAVVGMGIEAQRDGLPIVVGTLAGPGGMKIPFREHWSSWVVGRFFRQVRDLESPFVKRSDYRAALIDVPGGVRPQIEMRLTGPAWASPVRRMTALQNMKAGWSRSLAALADGDPAAARTLTPEATAALTRWRDGADAALVDRFADHFRHGRPTDLTRMRAYVLADRWALPRTDVLDALLAGVEAGATELFWSARCRRCYGQLAGGRLLSDLADHVHCPACGIRTETDLGDSVEVLFAPHPSVVTAIEVNYCTMFPAMAPAQQAVLTMAPGQSVTTELHLPPGNWRLGPGQGLPDVDVVAGEAGGEEIHWESGDTGAQAVRAGPTRLSLHNRDDALRRVFLVRGAPADPVVTAAQLTTMPRFRRRLGHQVLAKDLRLGVRAVTLLFTDLSGSTAMYEAVGDARAFAVVRDHFVLLQRIVEAHGGCVVKTIGDAVMAAFFDSPSAVRAALAMCAEFRGFSEGLALDAPLSLKLGIHAGPALAVHSEASGLDYFGGTVNLAARAQGKAEGGELMLTDAVMGHPEVTTMLMAHEVDEVHAALKGLGDVRLWRVRASG